MAKCSQCLHWDACSMLFEIAIGRKPTANGNKAEEKCPHFKDKTINTNADRIRAMSDELLATQLVRVFCEGVKLLTEIDVPDEIADEFRDSVLKRLKQPAEE